MAATDKELGDLHKMVAEGLSADLAGAREIEDVAVRIASVKEVRAQAIAFLKNNSITADVSTNAALAGLKEQLAAKRKDRPRAELADALAQFESMNPGLPS